MPHYGSCFGAEALHVWLNNKQNEVAQSKKNRKKAAVISCEVSSAHYCDLHQEQLGTDCNNMPQHISCSAALDASCACRIVAGTPKNAKEEIAGSFRSYRSC